jgi:hypothetical protein
MGHLGAQKGKKKKEDREESKIETKRTSNSAQEWEPDFYVFESAFENLPLILTYSCGTVFPELDVGLFDNHVVF